VFGDWSPAMALASRSKRRAKSSSRPASNFTSLMAAGRASIVWLARQTSPMPPSPIGEIRW
jgi:hypothetical protein